MVVGEALGILLVVLFKTLRLTTIGHEHVLEEARSGRRIVLVGWHGHDLVHLSAFSAMFPSARGVIIVEDNFAGHVLLRAANRLGADGAALSLDPDSIRSARGIVRLSALIRQGRLGLLAVDGPAGPALEVKPGAAFIALRTSALIVPCATAASPALLLPRWDRHLVPLPFARVVIAVGQSIETDWGAGESPTVEGLSAEIARSLSALVLRAEREV